jgi:hypothetical protein
MPERGLKDCRVELRVLSLESGLPTSALRVKELSVTSSGPSDRIS